MPILKIDPVTRIEGHLKVELQVDDSTEPFPKVSQAQCSGSLFRGIEIILKGRDPRDSIQITQRICGVCSTCHGTTSALALDQVFNVRPPDNAILIRNIIEGGDLISDHILHFYIMGGPEWGVLAEIPEMLPPVKAGLGAHYVNAIEMRRKAHELTAIFSGKMPHSMAYTAGGVTTLLTADKISLAQAKMTELKDFVRDVMIPDSEKIVNNLKKIGLFDLVKTVGTGPGKFLSYGIFPTPETYEDRRKWLFKPTPGFDEKDIRESLKHSWYDETWTNKHPSEKETKDSHEKPDAYSWITAPRYKGEVYEAGPLARMVNSDLYDLIEPTGSALDRILARVNETSITCDAMIEWLSDLKVGEKVFRRWNKYPEVPDKAEGAGLWEAPRGALGHWIKVEEKKIQRYQVITPTNWNASPKDENGKSGAMEEALEGTLIPKMDTYGFLTKLGHPIAEKVKSLGLSDLNYWDGYNATLPLMIIRSFDPCLACAVHLITMKKKPANNLTRTFNSAVINKSSKNWRIK